MDVTTASPGVKVSAKSQEILGSPFKLGNLTIKNRYVLSPMAVLQPTMDGLPSEQTVAFLTRRVEGGAGLLIIGGTVSTERGYDEAPFQPLMRFDRDELVPGLKKLVDRIHETGTPIIAQIFPSFGSMGIPAPGRPTRGASPVGVKMGAPRLPKGISIPGGRMIPPPHEVTKEEILEIQGEVLESVRRAQEAGFDGIELGAHMRYFYSTFFSPRTNLRTDEYGGSAENRARAMADVIRAIRKQVGSEYPVGLRMSVNEHLEGGMRAEGFAEIAGLLAKEGLTYIALTDGNYESMDDNLPARSGVMLEHGEPQAFRSAVGPNVVLMLANTYLPDQCATAIEDGHGDAIMLGRQLLADPDFPNKVLEGRMDEIIWCDHSNECLRRLILNVPVRCHLNQEMGRESSTASKTKFKQELTIKMSGSTSMMAVADFMAKKFPARGHH